MTKKIFKGIGDFNARIQQDHMSAYAATCAYFLMLSFVPLIMILLAIIRRTPFDETILMNGIISVVPAGIRDFVSMVINEVYSKSFAIVPISVLILLWAASKAIHALTNGLNVISKVSETRGWWFIRFRSMAIVLIATTGCGVLAVVAVWSARMRQSAEEVFPLLQDLITFFMPFRNLIGYVILIVIFVLLYTVLPNESYSFRSQLPGALLVATVWCMVSYFMTLYYMHNHSFQSIYGTLTGVILAMIWLYLCMYFVLVGAEINRIIYENPEDNVIVNTIHDVREEQALRRETLQKEIERQKLMATDELFRKEKEKTGPLTTDSGEHELDDETGIDLNLVRQGVYQHEDLMEDENERHSRES